MEKPPNLNNQEQQPASTPAEINAKLLEKTIYSVEEKERRARRFEEVWQQVWKPKPGKGNYFQTPRNESPFEGYSSKGWKIHLPFKKGVEKEVCRILYENGLYFKIETDMGTYFNGLKESGSTIYIGSYDNMQKILQLLRVNFSEYLGEGAIVVIGPKKIHVGSGSDIQLIGGITARFDVAKTEHGWATGDGKYAERGLASWTGFGGIPILKKYEEEAVNLEKNWNNLTDGQRKLILFKIYGESRRELIKDYGKEFLLGSQVKI